MPKYKPEEKGTATVEESTTYPNTMMEVDKALRGVGTFFEEFEYQFIDKMAEADFNIAKDDYQHCMALFDKVAKRYAEEQLLIEDDLLAILAIIGQIKLYVISNINDDDNDDIF